MYVRSIRSDWTDEDQVRILKCLVQAGGKELALTKELNFKRRSLGQK